MWNFCEVFADNSDKANLITAVISVIAAVLVVFLTHILASRRSGAELRTKKLEGSYFALSKFKDAGWKLMHEQAVPSDVQSDTYIKYGEAHNELEMLSAIYIPEISKYVSEMHLLVLLAKKIEDHGVDSFRDNLNKFVEMNFAAEQKILKQIKKIV